MSGLAIHNIFELRPLPRHQRYFKSDWIQSIESNKQIDFSAVNELELHAMPHSGNSIVFHIMKQKALKVKNEKTSQKHTQKTKQNKKEQSNRNIIDAANLFQCIHLQLFVEIIVTEYCYSDSCHGFCDIHLDFRSRVFMCVSIWTHLFRFCFCTCTKICSSIFFSF